MGLAMPRLLEEGLGRAMGLEAPQPAEGLGLLTALVLPLTVEALGLLLYTEEAHRPAPVLERPAVLVLLCTLQCPAVGLEAVMG